MTPHQQDYISRTRQLARDLLEAYSEAKALQLEWNALDYGTNLPTLAESAAENPPFVDANTKDGVGGTEAGAFLFATIDAITTVLNAGSATNIAKLL